MFYIYNNVHIKIHTHNFFMNYLDSKLQLQLPLKHFTYVCRRRRQWHPSPVLLPGKSHGRRSLVGCSPWGREELDTTDQLHFHFSVSCTGEGNGNPIQCSCLENPRDEGACWAAVYGVTQSQTGLKRLSSSSRSVLQSFVLLWLLLFVFCCFFHLSSLPYHPISQNTEKLNVKIYILRWKRT